MSYISRSEFLFETTWCVTFRREDEERLKEEWGQQNDDGWTREWTQLASFVAHSSDKGAFA